MNRAVFPIPSSEWQSHDSSVLYKQLIKHYSSNPLWDYDLSRGRPATEQLNLAKALDGYLKSNYQDMSGSDVRLYGQNPAGLTEARQLFASLLGLEKQHIFVYGNSSLQLIYFSILFAWLYGVLSNRGRHQTKPWLEQQHGAGSQGKIKFICPVPGYDRHFRICEAFGIDMITVAMTKEGPDMDAVERLTANDPLIKGIFCVPHFSNPCGAIYSADTVQRLASVAADASAEDFRIIWDDAYGIHAFDFDDNFKQQRNIINSIMPLCVAKQCANALLVYASTSKISFSGAGIATMGASSDNIAYLLQYLAISSIGADRVNQLRHARYFIDYGGLQKHMKKHAAILKPKFQLVHDYLSGAFNAHQKQYNGETWWVSQYGRWREAKGGYFILFYSQKKKARFIVQLANDIGLKLTPAGATWPYGKDPDDQEIRLAPTALDKATLEKALACFVLCVKHASSITPASEHNSD